MNFISVDNIKLSNYLDFLIAEKNNKNKINNNSIITSETLELLKRAHMNGVLENMFYKHEIIKPTGSKYKLELTCQKCGNNFSVVVSKTKLINYIKNKCIKNKNHNENHYGKYDCNPNELDICDCCKQLINNEMEIQNQIVKKERSRIKKENTKIYIDTLLNPTNIWSEDTSVAERNQIVQDSYVNDDEIADYIKSMDYNDFLNTPYWKAITYMCKRNAHFKCQLCNKSTKYLVTHHKTYEYHGYEHRRKNKDLIVLCSDCHKKFHNITEG